MLVNLEANQTHVPLNILGTSLRGMPKGRGLADKYFIDTKSNFNSVFSIRASRIKKATFYSLEMMVGTSPKLLQLMAPWTRTPAALPSSICL